MKNQAGPEGPMVRMAGIQKTFHRGSVNEKILFKGLDLDIPRGEFVTVVGSNGSGKTTLLNLLSGSVRADAGEITIAGKHVESMPEYRRARAVGRVFQDPSLGTCANLTLLENMSLADNKGGRYLLQRGVDRRRTDAYRALLEPLGIGLENQMHTPVGNLSGGQRQALSLLLCTMTPIDLLLLDEHTAALDPRSSETVMALTDRIVRQKGLTALMVTHNLRYATAHGDRLLMLHQGELVVDVSSAERGAYGVERLLRIFSEISIELGN